MEYEHIKGTDLRPSRIALGTFAIGRWLWGGTNEQESINKNDPKFQDPRYLQYLEAVDRLDRFAEDNKERSVLPLAVRWALDKGANITLWGARRPDQLDPIKKVLGWKLNTEDFTKIEEILNNSIQDPIGPKFMAPPSR